MSNPNKAARRNRADSKEPPDTFRLLKSAAKHIASKSKPDASRKIEVSKETDASERAPGHQ